MPSEPKLTEKSEADDAEMTIPQDEKDIEEMPLPKASKEDILTASLPIADAPEDDLFQPKNISGMISKDTLEQPQMPKMPKDFIDEMILEEPFLEKQYKIEAHKL